MRINPLRLGLFFGVLLASAAAADDAAVKTQRLFFDYVKERCGQQFSGVTEFPQDPKHDFAGKKLVALIDTCTDREIRIRFHVGEDSSRTWVITRGEKGLLLKHDHRHPDGTPDQQTNYGGWAIADGTSQRQRFAADEETAKLIPEAATNVWTLEFDAGKQQFIYALERNNAPRYKAVFSLKTAAP